MKDKFNLLYIKPQSTSSKQMILEEETANHEKDQTLDRRKRKHNEIESTYSSKPLQNKLSTYSTSKLILQPVDTISNLTFEKKDTPQIKTSDNTKLQALETLEKYLTMDERYIEMDKNIGTNIQSK